MTPTPENGTSSLQERANARRRVIRRMRRGGCLVRDEIGGAVGLVYRWADRGGAPSIDPDTIERLRETGCTIAGVPHQLVALDGPATPTFALREAAEA